MSAVFDHVISELLLKQRASSGALLGISFLEEMVKQSALEEELKMQLAKIRSELNSKNAIIGELENQMRSNEKMKVPEIAMRLACILDNPADDNRILLSILSNLLGNNQAHNKHWNDDTKDLFAIILDYRGPALAKIVSERLCGPSLKTCYRRARATWSVRLTLKEDTMKRAAAFYARVDYKGPFILAVDATALSPS